jgi:hypothetical protein
MAACGPEVFGADPARVKWNVVRGDTSTIRVEFLEDDEVTFFDIDGWTFSATAYDPRTDIVDPLVVEVFDGYVDIIAPATTTSLWGSGYGSVVAELGFDLEVVTDEDITWTPVIGTITVLGDVSGGSL